MLNTILSVSGKPGLHKMISQGKNMLIVESLADKKRQPVYARDKVISLNDIAIYTDKEEEPLHKVLAGIKEKEESRLLPFDLSIAKPEELRNYLAAVLPNFDRDRVYPGDIKKLLGWYNLLITSGITDFTSQEQEPSGQPVP